jgi:hypothetical protein
MVYIHVQWLRLPARVLLHAGSARRQFSTFTFRTSRPPRVSTALSTGGCGVTGESVNGNIDARRMGVCNTIITKRAELVSRLHSAWLVGMYREALPNLAGIRVVAQNDMICTRASSQVGVDLVIFANKKDRTIEIIEV